MALDDSFIWCFEHRVSQGAKVSCMTNSSNESSKKNPSTNNGTEYDNQWLNDQQEIENEDIKGVSNKLDKYLKFIINPGLDFPTKKDNLRVLCIKLGIYPLFNKKFPFPFLNEENLKDACKYIQELFLQKWKNLSSQKKDEFQKLLDSLNDMTNLHDGGGTNKPKENNKTEHDSQELSSQDKIEDEDVKNTFNKGKEIIHNYLKFIIDSELSFNTKENKLKGLCYNLGIYSSFIDEFPSLNRDNIKDACKYIEESYCDVREKLSYQKRDDLQKLLDSLNDTLKRGWESMQNESEEQPAYNSSNLIDKLLVNVSALHYGGATIYAADAIIAVIKTKKYDDFIYESQKNIWGKIHEEEININDYNTQYEAYSTLDNLINKTDNDSLKNTYLNKVLLYAIIIGIDIKNENDVDEFIKTIKWEKTNYTLSYKNFIHRMVLVKNGYIREYAIKSLTAKYERANKLAETRKFYESDFINFNKSNTNPQNPSGLQIASRITNLNDKLNHYKFNSWKSEDEDAALKYTAFDTAFNNDFNLSDPTIQRIAELWIDLRSESSRYNFYNSESNYFNLDSRNKFVSEKLQGVLTVEEISSLQERFQQLPDQVNNNYEILSGNFDADQNDFEKIKKIYALGEVIDKIKNFFSGMDNKKLWDYMWLQLDEKEPADVRGDYLFMKWTVNWTETYIKYNLRTWKLFINSFTQEFLNLNPPKITIWNTEPNTEIWNLWSFNDIIEWYDAPFHLVQTDKDENNQNLGYGDDASANNDDKDSPNNKEIKNSIEWLYKDKLENDLKNIWKIVQEKAWEQSKENNAIYDFLKTFNILPDNLEPKNLEFMWWSKLFTVLESIKNTNNEVELRRFSELMKELMSYCWLKRWKNNEYSQGSNFTSFTIFDIDEKNATTDIVSLQVASEKFFVGEKLKLKNSESHFDWSIQLSFADIIVSKCCKNTWRGWRISITDMENYVNSIKDWFDISDCETRLASAYNY